MQYYDCNKYRYFERKYRVKLEIKGGKQTTIKKILLVIKICSYHTIRLIRIFERHGFLIQDIPIT